MTKSKSWVVGIGHEETKAKTIPDDSVTKAVGAIDDVVKRAMKGGGHADSLLSTLVAKCEKSGSGKYAIKTLARDAGVSLSFARFHAKTKLKSELAERGGRVTELTASSITVEWHGDTSPAAPAKAKKKATVKAPKKARKTAIKMGKDYFCFDPIIKAKIRAAITVGQNFWLAGPTGTGKSEYYERIIEEDGGSFVKVSFNGESSTDDLLGHYQLRDGETVWVEGALGEAAEKGIPLICEEVDAAPAEANLAMQRALEQRHGRERTFYNARNGRSYTCKAGFMILATANSTGGGDHTGLYAGVQLQNAAFRDRFAFEYIDYLNREEEVKVLVARTGLSTDLAGRVVKLAQAARQALTNGELFTPISTRTLLAFGNLVTALEVAFKTEEADPVERKALAIKEAMLSTVVHKAANPSDAEALRGMIQRIFDL